MTSLSKLHTQRTSSDDENSLPFEMHKEEGDSPCAQDTRIQLTLTTGEVLDLSFKRKSKRLQDSMKFHVTTDTRLRMGPALGQAGTPTPCPTMSYYWRGLVDHEYNLSIMSTIVDPECRSQRRPGRSTIVDRIDRLYVALVLTNPQPLGYHCSGFADNSLQPLEELNCRINVAHVHK